MDIIFSKSIDPLSKDKFIKNVIDICDLTSLNSDPSFEGGFNLPLTYEWYEKELNNKHLLKYHNKRQLRFVSDNFSKRIIGLRYKDGINYWNKDEIFKLKNSIEKVLLDIY